MGRVKKKPDGPAEGCKLFFEQLLGHVKGELAGESFKLSDWQWKDIIQPLFGTLRADGTRQYRTCYIEIPRKMGKSTLAAGIALYLLFADQEPGAEVVSAAADREQASIVFDMAKIMIENSPILSQRCTVYRKWIETKTGGVYKAISADAYTKHGMNLSGIIFDEVHCQPNRELWDTLQTSTGARRQPLTFAITTAGYDRESLCYELHKYAKGVKEGTIVDPAFLPVIYAAGDDDDWTQEETWKKANPGYGVSVQADYFRQQVLEAKASPGKEMAFRRLHLCQWTEGVSRWINLEKWDACLADPWPDLAGQPCWGALDLSSTTDLTSLSLSWPVEQFIFCKTWSWAPRGAMKERERRNRVRIDTWAHQGNIEITAGDVVDYDAVVSKLFELSKIYQIKEIAIDRWNASHIAQVIQAQGLPVVAFGQGFASMSPACKDFEALVLSGRFKHDGNPVFRWAVGNVSIQTDAAGNIKPSKERSLEKIDPAVAAIMATARARVQSVTDQGSIYEKSGLFIL